MTQRMRRLQEEEGFTLIELLVVIIILGILAAVVVFATGGFGDRGQGAACSIDERTLATAQEAWFASADHGDGSYAPSAATLVPDFLNDVSEWHTTDGTGAVTAIAGGPCV